MMRSKIKYLITVLVFIFSINFSSATLSDDLIAYWKLDETSGAVIEQVAGLNGSILNSTGRGYPGIINSSFYFNATTQDIVNLTSLPIPTNFSFSLWINPVTIDAVGRTPIFSGNILRNYSLIILSQANGILAETRGNGGGITQVLYNQGIEVDNWYHVVQTYDQSTSNLTLYINGNPVNSSIGSSGEVILNEETHLGTSIRDGGPNPLYFNGSIDEVVYWNRTLTSAEIGRLYNFGEGHVPFDSLVTLSTPPSNGFTARDFYALIFPPDGNMVQNTTLEIYNSTGSTILNLNNSYNTNDTNFTVTTLAPGVYLWNVLACLNDNNCYLSPENRTVNFGASFDQFIFNSSVYETSLESYILNVTRGAMSTISSAQLFYNGDSYTTTLSNSGNYSLISRSFDVRTDLTSNSFSWGITFSNGVQFNSTSKSQTIDPIVLGICNSSLTVPYLNITYRNETINQENVTAFVSSSTWSYYLGTGSVNQTLSYSDASEETNHTFCFIPQDRTLYTTLQYSYGNSESQQRTYNPELLTLTNSSTNSVLWLLPTNDGIFVTFRVLNVAGQTISNADISISRSGSGVISQTKTGGDGTATIFLNPNIQYTISVSKSGFPSFSTTQTFPLTEYTITLGSSNTLPDDYSRGITIKVNPKIGAILDNGTDYNFNLTLNSSVWTVTEFGFNLQNSSGTSFGSTSTSTVPSTVSTTINTGNQTHIIMNYYYIINSSYVNSSIYWTVSDVPEGSIKGFFDRLSSYLPYEPFGLNRFSLNLIIFLTIFIIVGVMSYNFGLRSPAVIVGLAFALVYFFDVVGIIGGDNAGFISFVAFIIWVASLVWQGGSG